MKEERTLRSLAIDRHALDREWVEQPEMAYEAGLDVAASSRAEELARNELKVVEAELAREARLHPKKFGLERVTEDAVKGAVLLHPTRAAAFAAWVEAAHENAVARAWAVAVEHRKKALENEVVLDGRDHYAVPRVPSAAAEAARDRIDHAAKAATRRSQARDNGK